MSEVKALTPVESSNIEAMGHDPVTQVMTVKFKNGTVYDYQKVNKEIYMNILNASSVGGAFNASVKKFPLLFPFTKVA